MYDVQVCTDLISVCKCEFLFASCVFVYKKPTIYQSCLGFSSPSVPLLMIKQYLGSLNPFTFQSWSSICGWIHAMVLLLLLFYSLCFSCLRSNLLPHIHTLSRSSAFCVSSLCFRPSFLSELKSSEVQHGKLVMIRRSLEMKINGLLNAIQKQKAKNTEQQSSSRTVQNDLHEVLLTSRSFLLHYALTHHIARAGI